MAKAYSFTPSGLVGNWNFGNGTGTNRRGVIVDESGQGNNGTVYGAAALSFDGTNDNAAVATPWDTLGGHRYMWWAGRIKLNAQAAIRVLWHDTWNTAANSKIFLTVTATDYLNVGVRTGATGDTYRSATSSSTLSEGSWFSLLVAIDLGTDGTVANGLTAYAWVDGAVFTMGAFSGDATQGTWAADVSDNQIIGTQGDGASNDLSGYAQWLGYSGMDTLPTITDAQQFNDNPQAWLANSGLDAYWHCKEGSGNPQDISGNAHHLALTGTTWDVTDNGGNAYAQSGGAGDSFYSGKRWFDGTDDYVSVANAAELVFGTGDFQIHVWAKISSGGADPETIMVKGNPATTGWRLRHTGGEVEFTGDNDGTAISLTSTIGGSGITDDALHLISILRDGTDASVLIDGASSGTDATANGDLSATSAITICKGAVSYTTGDIYQVLIGTGSKTIAQGTADAAALFAQGAFK